MDACLKWKNLLKHDKKDIAKDENNVRHRFQRGGNYIKIVRRKFVTWRVLRKKNRYSKNEFTTIMNWITKDVFKDNLKKKKVFFFNIK